MAKDSSDNREIIDSLRKLKNEGSQNKNEVVEKLRELKKQDSRRESTTSRGLSKSPAGETESSYPRTSYPRTDTRNDRTTIVKKQKTTTESPGKIPNANLILMSLTVILLIAIMGLVLFFNDRYVSLTNKYQSDASQMDLLRKNLESRESEVREKESMLNSLMSNLSIKEEREESLSSEYSSLEEEKSNLETTISSLQTSLSECNSNSADLSSQLIEATEDRNTYKDSYERTLSKLSDAYADLSDIKECVENYNLTACL